MKPTKREYGYTPAGKWNNEWSRYLDYLEAMKAWENRTPKLPGRPQSKNLHPSWIDYIAHFDPCDTTRSQSAFCRWAGMSTSVLSAAKRKPITNRIELLISQWIEELESGDFGIMPQFQSEYERLMEKD